MDITEKEKQLLIDGFQAMKPREKSIIFEVMDSFTDIEIPARFQLLKKAYHYRTELYGSMVGMQIAGIEDFKKNFESYFEQLYQYIFDNFEDGENSGCKQITDMESLYWFLLGAANNDEKREREIKRIYNGIYANRYCGKVSGYTRGNVIKIRNYEKRV